MSVVEPGSAAPSLIPRVRNLLLQPRAEWDVIAQERTPLMALLVGFVLPLAALAAICSFIGMVFIGVGGFGFSVKVPMMAGLASLVTQLVMSLAGVWLLGFVINALAANFGATPDQTQANQLAAYSGAAAYVGAVFTLVPPLSILAVLGGVYSLVLLFLGLPRLMKAPDDKRVGYFVVILLVTIVASFVAFAAIGAIRGAIGFAGAPFAAAPAPEPNASVTLPNGQTLDLSELSKAAEDLQSLQNDPEAAAAAAVTAEQLRALLPASLPGGLAQTEISTSSAGMPGAAIATAVYANGDRRIELSVTDMGAMAGLAGMAGAFGVQGTRETADGYERVHQVDGRMVVEELSRSAHRAKYGVVAAQRIIIAADGANVSEEDVRAAVNAVGVARVEALAAQGPR